jgi:hypothetical protein
VCWEKRKTTSLSKEANINSDFTPDSKQTGIQLAHGFTSRDRPLPLSSRCTRTIRPTRPAPRLGNPATTAAAHACQFTMCRAWMEGRSVLVPSVVPATRWIAHASPTSRPISRESARVQKSGLDWTLVLVPRLLLARQSVGSPARYFLVAIVTVSAPSGRRHRAGGRPHQLLAGGAGERSRSESAMHGLVSTADQLPITRFIGGSLSAGFGQLLLLYCNKRMV